MEVLIIFKYVWIVCFGKSEENVEKGTCFCVISSDPVTNNWL